MFRKITKLVYFYVLCVPNSRWHLLFVGSIAYSLVNSILKTMGAAVVKVCSVSVKSYFSVMIVYMAMFYFQER